MISSLRLYFVLIASLCLFASTSANAIEIPLSCADSNTLEIRVTDVSHGCKKSEYSLGAGAIMYSGIPKSKLDDQVLYRFKAAEIAAKKDGVRIYIASGFRTIERQRYLFNQAVKKYGSKAEAAKWVSPPEYSHHPQGLAVDVNYPNDRKGAKWLEEHGSTFGLCRVFENEWWHFEPVIAPGWKCPHLMKDASLLLPKT